MLDESKRRELLIEKIAYKNWELRTIQKDEDENPLIGYGSPETDYSKAVKIVSAFEDGNEDKETIKDYLDLYQDILENYFTKDYLSTYVQ